ncbi:MAG TPA: MG2 domain-containing protein, partial [candidate division Zixibacteria bacterium]
MIWKSIILGLSLVFFLQGVGAASKLKEADELFDKGTFQEALKIYESVYKETSDSQTCEKAFFRICESLAHLFRYGEAAQKLFSTEVPRQLPQYPRFLILKAEIFRNFLMQYSYLQRGDKIDEYGKEVFRLTPNEIRNEIRKAYIELWELRGELVKMDIRGEGYFLDIDNIDFGMYPTFFDYLIFSWTDFLLRTEASYVVENAVCPGAELLLVEKFKRSVDLNGPPALLAAELMEEASRFGGTGRLEANERWKIRRLLLPLRYSNLFNLKGLAEDKTLYDGKDLRVCRDHTKAILFRWMDVFETREAKAEAGYEAAMILNSDNKPAEVVTLCERIERTFPGTHASRHAQALRSQIQMPTLYLVAKTVLPPAQGAFTITTKNLKKVYFRIYRINPEELKGRYINYRKEEYGNSYDSFDGWSGVLNLNWSYRDWGKKLLESYLSRKNACKEWSTQTGDKSNYETLVKTIDPPALEAGMYLVFVCGDGSFKIGSSLLSACFLNVTDLVLLGTAGFTTNAIDAYHDFIDDRGPDHITDNAFHFYTLDAKTGRPINGAKLDVYVYLSHQSKRESSGLRTNKEGSVSLSLPLVISPFAQNYYYADPLAQRDGSFAYWRQNQSLNYYPPSPLVLFTETDRPIYKPGDKVEAKVVVVRRIPQGFRTFDKTQKVIFSARDPNAKEFFNQTVKLGEFGSASVNFEIPGGRLLGRYSLNVSCQDGRFNNNASIFFSVEEYKQPEFEIEFKTAEEPWKYGQPGEIKGEVTYYFGGPVPDAPITYHIKRQTYVPYCYRWWFGESHSGSGYEVATGQTKTDSKGNFVIPFTPEAVPGSYAGYVPDISQFSVELEAHDTGGRTVEAQQSYRVGKNAIYLVIEPEKGFYLENETIEIKSKLLTINDAPAQGASSYEVFSLKDTTTKSLADIGYGYYGGYWSWIPPLDVQLKDVPNEKLLAQGKIKHDKDGKGIIRIRPLHQGAYRIVEKTPDKWGGEVAQTKILVVVKDTKTVIPVNAASVTLVEKDEYKIGEVARFVIGSGLASGIYHIELWAGEHLLSHQLIDGSQPVRLIEVPVTGRMKGGFTLRWFGVKDFDVHYGQATVLVPWNEKKIKVSLKPFNKELKPDQEYSWGVRLTDAKGWP